jgi:tetratricopeptide (TPR) repeat protein
MTPGQAADALESLRFRWRGDDTELAIIQALGHVYEDMGRWREALSVMHAASARFPSLPAARRLRIDMGAMFERLFLDGEADKLEPIQALGLFYEFKDLTPIGSTGDRMIRLLSARLVKVDLLDKAAELLQYQVDNRLDGVGQAQVAVDLASIYLAGKQPEKAMLAIENTRQPGVPSQIAAERRLVEAKALLDLGNYEHAAELLEKDTSLEAAAVRAEIAWRQKDWALAATAFQIVLARGPDPDGELKDADRANVLRAAIAACLSDNDPSIARLKRVYGQRMAASPDAAAFELVLSKPDASDYRLKDLARRLARSDLIGKVLEDLKTKLAKEAIKPPASPKV